jgi:hypothetical protein
MQPTTPAVALKFVRILKNAVLIYRTYTHRAAADAQAVGRQLINACNVAYNS